MRSILTLIITVLLTGILFYFSHKEEGMLDENGFQVYYSLGFSTFVIGMSSFLPVIIFSIQFFELGFFKNDNLIFALITLSLFVLLGIYIYLHLSKRKIFYDAENIYSYYAFRKPIIIKTKNIFEIKYSITGKYLKVLSSNGEVILINEFMTNFQSLTKYLNIKIV